MSRFAFTQATVLFTSLTFATSGRSQEPSPSPLPLPNAGNKPERSDSRVLVLEKGPIHEGFAQPGAQVRGKGITAPKAPPLPVNEIPPEPKPGGAGVKWIPGYWAWEADRTDFIWVCGCYRNVPPERTWESGRWKEVNRVWTYFPGYWRPTDGKTLTANLPEPPASKEDAPTSNDNPKAMWVPGIWEHKNAKFEWQPGYWPPSQESMMWQQSQYVATETGFAFVPGHWDYAIEERGVLFSPVEFSSVQREKRGWSYRPEFAISFGSEAKWGEGGVFDALFIGPNYNNYYYGDYSRLNVAASFLRELPMSDFVPGLSNPLVEVSESVSYQPWKTVSTGYTNPLLQHYVRLNRADSGFVKGATPSDSTKLSRGANPLAFVEGGVGCAPPGCAVPYAGTKTTVGYQHVSPRGSVTTGTMQFRSFAPPSHSGRYYR